MITCPQKRVTRFRSGNNDATFQTAYKRSYYYETPPVHPLFRARVTKTLTEDLKTSKSYSNNYVSIYKQAYDTKFTGRQPERYGRLSAMKKSSLKSLHEIYVKQLIKPLKSGLTTTGLTYIPQKKPFVPLALPRRSPIDDATCSITPIGEFPPISPNEPGSQKHLDPLVSTTHLNHVNFTSDQRNSSSKNDTITYYNTIASQRPSESVPSIGPYFPRCDNEPHPIYPKKFRLIPYKGNRSTYENDYAHVPRKPILWQPNVRFPLVFKLSRNEVLVTPAMYCTEQSHVASGSQSRVV